MKLRITLLLAALLMALLLPAPPAGAAEGEVVGSFTFRAGDGPVTFQPRDGGTAFRLTVKNGDSRGKDRVSSATVLLNGKALFGPNAFNQNVSSLALGLDDDALDGGEKNTLEAVIKGRPEAFLTVTLFADYPEPVSKVVYYLDRDGDGYGSLSPRIEVDAGSSPPRPPNPAWSWVTLGGDLNDYDPGIHP